MPELAILMNLLDALLIPAVGAIALLMAKLTRGAMARKCERSFYVFLIVMTAITLRTVVICDKCWLIHTLTLGLMVIGALTIPDQSAYEHSGCGEDRFTQANA